MTVKRAAIAGACLLTVGLTAAANAADLAGAYSETPPAYATAPAGACTDRGVLGFITNRFEYKASNYLRQDLSIYEIRRAHLSRFEPFNGYISSVQREYCLASATLTDGTERELVYVIERPWGFAGVGRSIEFCIPDLDPWHVYGYACAAIR